MVPNASLARHQRKLETGKVDAVDAARPPRFSGASQQQDWTCWGLAFDSAPGVWKEWYYDDVL